MKICTMCNIVVAHKLTTESVYSSQQSTKKEEVLSDFGYNKKQASDRDRQISAKCGAQDPIPGHRGGRCI